MFQNWGFLITEIFFLLLLAALLGLFCGWLIWGRKCKNCTGKMNLADDINASRKKAATTATAAVTGVAATAAATGTSAKAAVADKATAAVSVDANQDFDGDGILEGKNEGVKPTTLTAARGGKADDLKMIKGVGPRMEEMLHGMGFFHFDQIAEWKSEELAWVDANLDGFHGRASRDQWVAQAKILATGGTTEFSNRVEKGDVY